MANNAADKLDLDGHPGPLGIARPVDSKQDGPKHQTVTSKRNPS
jgi:hypothetical protein